MAGKSDFLAEFDLPTIPDEILGRLDQAAETLSLNYPSCKSWWREHGGRLSCENLLEWEEAISQQHAENLLRLLKISGKFPYLKKQLKKSLTSCYRRKRSRKIQESKVVLKGRVGYHTSLPGGW